MTRVPDTDSDHYGSQILIRKEVKTRELGKLKIEPWRLTMELCGFASLQSKMSDLYPDTDPHLSEKPKPDPRCGSATLDMT
jgi:hypothetical protein